MDQRNTPRRVGIVFSGGPAPGANAVIAAAASSFRRAGSEVLGILRGYSRLEQHTPGKELVSGTHYRLIEDRDLQGLRNARGVLIGTARANPGKAIKGPADFELPAKVSGL